MKRLLIILLVLALAGFVLSGCDRRSAAPEETEGQDGSFSPETTAVGGLTQAVEDQSSADPADTATEEPTYVEPIAVGAEDADPVDIDVTDADPEETPDPEAADQPEDAEDGAENDGETAAEPTPDSDMPFATPTPQPNTFISEYAEVSAPGLGFRLSYPADWVNIPGRSTVCYVQPLENGTVYPARVAVTMKRMPHATNYDEAQTELANYIKTLMTQYNQSTFKVNTKLDYDTKFMGKAAIATTYLAYDGPQEIIGYTIITYFERYLYVFHFLCAYEDYNAFSEAMKYMRDSVQADAKVAPK